MRKERQTSYKVQNSLPCVKIGFEIFTIFTITITYEPYSNLTISLTKYVLPLTHSLPFPFYD